MTVIFSDAAIECDEVGPADSGATAVAASSTTVTATFGTDYAGNQPTLNRVKWILAIYTFLSSNTIGAVDMTLNDGTHTQNCGSFATPGVNTKRNGVSGRDGCHRFNDADQHRVGHCDNRERDRNRYGSTESIRKRVKRDQNDANY